MKQNKIIKRYKREYNKLLYKEKNCINMPKVSGYKHVVLGQKIYQNFKIKKTQN